MRMARIFYELHESRFFMRLVRFAKFALAPAGPRDHLPLKQGLRLAYHSHAYEYTIGQRPSSTKTRIKTRRRRSSRLWQ